MNAAVQKQAWTWALFLAGPGLETEFISLEAVGERSVVLTPSRTKGTSVHACQIGMADGGISQPLVAKSLRTLSEQAQSLPSCVWVGDRDSLDSRGLETLDAGTKSGQIETILLPVNKDVSDGAALLDELRKRDVTLRDQPLVVSIFGALGGRRDHERLFIDELCRVFFEIDPHPGGTCLVLQPELVITDLSVEMKNWSGGRDLSIRCSSPDKAVEMDGLEHSGSIVLQRPTHGLSNRILGERLRVAPASGSWVEIYFNL